MKHLHLLCLGCGSLLLLAISSGWPYGFYVLLRWVICGSCVYLTWQVIARQQVAWAVAFGAIGLLFNPIAPVFLAKNTWVVIDLISAGVFFVALVRLRHIEGEATR